MAPRIQSVRTLFISDVHLGSKDCKAEFLLHLLARVRADRIYLVGDIVDLWAMERQMFWPASHHSVLQKILQLAQSGTEVIYIPGNHDGVMRRYRHPDVAKIRIQRKAIHVTAAGKRLLVVHGDEFDGATCHGRWLTWLGEHLYTFLLWLNRSINSVRSRFGKYYWSLSAYIKAHVSQADRLIARYRSAALQEAQKRGLDGIVCGHIYHPEIVVSGGLIYANDGDWVENCTALVEHPDGELSLMRWTDADMAVAKQPKPSHTRAAEAA